MKVSIRLTKRQSLLLLISLATMIIVAVSSAEFHYSITKYVFAFSVVIVYLFALPKKLMNPKNILFFFYFVWYVLAPIFGSRYSADRMTSYSDKVGLAFLMCYVVYVVAMLTLDYSLGNVDDGELAERDNQNQSFVSRCITIVLLFIGMALFIKHSGGLYLWLTDANAAQFNRRGSGLYFLVYSLAFVVLAFFVGQEKDGKRAWVSKSIFLVFLLLNFELLTSKLTVITLLMLLFSDALLKSNLFGKMTIILGLSGSVVFIGGLVVRGFNVYSALSYALNYFNTFENFGILLKDYSPGFLTTFIMPFLWPFIKLGIVNQEFYDFNVWLTVQYTPDSWYIGQGTDQWNIESDLFLNYHFWGGVPFIILYFGIIAFLYKKVRITGGIWKLIYIYEAMLIMSHLRGGIFIFWYWYLIPLYVWLIAHYAPDAKVKVRTISTIINGRRANIE